jgi:4-amino-4-deoxy-L-arabinose transferase-like glycosyltransferase
MPEASRGDIASSERSPLGFALALGAIALVAFVVRVAFVVVVDPSVPKIGDASAYHLLAENLARGRGYIRPFDNLLLHKVRATAEYPPLFPALLAIPARLGVHSVEAQRIFMSAVGCITVVLVGLLGRRVTSPAVGLVAASLAALYPMLFQSEGILMAEALYALLVTAVLLLAYRAHAQPSIGRFAALGAAIGFATLTRAEGFLLGLVLLAPLAIGRGALPTRARLQRAGVALGVAVVVLLPWTVRNALQFHTFVPVSNNVATLVDGANCDATYSGTELGLWRESFSQVGDVARELPQARACFEGFDIADPNFDEAKVATKHRNDGLKYASHHLRSQPKVMAARVLRTWGLYAPHQQVNFETLEGRPHEWQWRGTLMYWVMLPFAIGGGFVLYKRRQLLWPLLATAVTVTIVSALTYGQQRFRIAAEPAILVLAAVAAVELVEVGRRAFRPPAPGDSPSDERIASVDAG